ncbi:hypothetical protein OROHE_011425 [Orobanche hederae]
MASFRRRLFPFGSSIPAIQLPLQSTNFALSGLCEGFRRSILHQFSSVVKTEQRVLKLEEEAVNQILEDEIAKIRNGFSSLKERFLKIPDAFNVIPKTDPKGIYVNKNLRLDNIQVFGFDYDYTLAHYSANLQSLIYDLAKEYLVNELRYPDSCLEFKYDNSFPIRGLYYDKSKGCLMKLDFFGSIEPDGCYFGRQKHFPVRGDIALQEILFEWWL